MGAAYKDVRYTFDEWPEIKRSEEVFRANPTTNIPYLELNGKILTQTYAILRHWARILGAYDGKTEDEKYFVDQITDIAIDCLFTNPHFEFILIQEQGGPSLSMPSFPRTRRMITPNTVKATELGFSRRLKPT
jgi:hypothetical protein